MRSPTAAHVARSLPGIDAESAGISRDADDPISQEQVIWADVVFVMEARQRKRLTELFAAHLKGKRIVVLNVRDEYDYVDPELIALLEPRIRAALA